MIAQAVLRAQQMLSFRHKLLSIFKRIVSSFFRYVILLLRILFNGALHDALNNKFLCEQIDDEYRQNSQQQASHQRPIIDGIGSIEVKGREWQRPLFRRLISTSDGSRKSFQIHSTFKIADQSPTLAASTGNTMRKNVCVRVQPSIIAASSSSAGIAFHKTMINEYRKRTSEAEIHINQRPFVIQHFSDFHTPLRAES